MAGEAAPTVEESASRIHADLAQIAVWLEPPVDVALASVPEELLDALAGSGDELRGITGELVALRGWLATGFQSLSIPLQNILNKLSEGRDPDVAEALWALQSILDWRLEWLTAGVGGLGYSLHDAAQLLHWDLMALASSIEISAGWLSAGGWGGGEPPPGFGQPAGTYLEIHWDELRYALEGVMSEYLPTLLGPPPAHESPAPPWLTQLAAAARTLVPALGLHRAHPGAAGGYDVMKGCMEWVRGPAAELLRPILADVEAAAKCQAPPTMGFAIEGAKAIGAAIQTWMKDTLKPGPIEPEQVALRLPACFAFTSGMGLLAHGIAALLSIDILGSVDLNCTGLAAAVADMAGFGPFTNALTGEFYDAYVRRPWAALCRDWMRPTKPSPDDLIRLHLKDRSATTPSPVADRKRLRRELAYAGFDDKWQDALIEDASHEPRQNELLIMGEADEPWGDEDYLKGKLLRMGYNEEDAEYMLEGLGRRQARSYINAWIGELQKQVRYGMIAPEDLDAALETAGVSPLVRQYAVEEAATAFSTQQVTDGITELKQGFARGEYELEDLRDGLTDLGLVPERVDTLVRLESVKRFRTKPVLRPDEETRAALATFRSAYRAGVLTEDAYASVLATAGIAEDVAALQLQTDRLARDRAIAAHLREYQLPALRDEARTEQRGAGWYRMQLRAIGFPDALVDAEVTYTMALADRDRRQRVERYQLPAIEEAYTWGLVDWAGVQRLYQEAGRSSDEIAARRLILDRLRKVRNRAVAAQGGAAATKPQSAAVRQAQAEWEYISGRFTAAQLTQLYIELGTPPDRAAARLTALGPLHV